MRDAGSANTDSACGSSCDNCAFDNLLCLNDPVIPGEGSCVQCRDDDVTRCYGSTPVCDDHQW